MTLLRGPLVALIAALCLAIPAAAFAQSAGDDQYADPFNEEQAPNKTLAQQDNSDTPSSPATDSAGTNPTSTSTSSDSAGRLAYTGFNLPLLFVTGAVMLLAGLTVRRVAAGPYSPR